MMDLSALAGLTGDAPEEPKKTTGKDREEIEVHNLDLLAAAETVSKALEGLTKQLKEEVKQELLSYWVSRTAVTCTKPESIQARGQEWFCRATPSKKTARSKLPMNVVETLREFGVEVEEVEETPERLVINPDLDQGTIMLMAKILTGDPRLKGKAIFLPQKRKAHFAVGERTVAEAVAKLPPGAIGEILPQLVTVVLAGYRPLWPTEDSGEMVNAALEYLREKEVL